MKGNVFHASYNKKTKLRLKKLSTNRLIIGLIQRRNILMSLLRGKSVPEYNFISWALHQYPKLDFVTV